MSRIHRFWLVASALIVILPATSQAQERPPADTTQTQQQQAAEMQQQMQQAQSMMSAMMHQVTQSTMEALANPETAQNLARFTRNYYNALVEQGFSEAQALTIVASLGFPQIPSM